MNFPPVKIGLFTSHHCCAQLPILTAVFIKYCEKLYYAILALITRLLLHHYIYEIFYRIFYRPQTKFAKVMFLQVSVCPRGRGAPEGGCLLQEGVSGPGGCVHPHPDGYCCGRYASYWNAFLSVLCALWGESVASFLYGEEVAPDLELGYTRLFWIKFLQKL